MEERLLDDFKPLSAKDWAELITKELKGTAFDSLSWNNAGLIGQPFYTKEDLPQHLPNLQFENDSPEKLGARHWVNHQVITVDDEKIANEKAILALNASANGIFFQTNGIPNFDILLKNILLPYCHIALQTNKDGQLLLQAFENYVAQSEFEVDQIEGFIASGEVLVWSNLPKFKSLLSVPKHQDTSFELALALAKTIDVLDQFDEASIEKHFENLQFELSVGTSYFIEIAKHRAFRLLLAQLAKAYHLNISPNTFQIVSFSGKWNEPTKDEYNYLLRACTQAMSAIIGGTNALVIQPFHELFHKNPAQGERMARNISTLLKDESYFDKTIDPAAGTYFLESLTEQIVQKSWAYLQAIEANGGLSKISTTTLEALTQNETV